MKPWEKIFRLRSREGYTLAELAIVVVIGGVATLAISQIGVMIYSAVANANRHAMQQRLTEALVKAVAGDTPCVMGAASGTTAGRFKGCPTPDPTSGVVPPPPSNCTFALVPNSPSNPVQSFNITAANQTQGTHPGSPVTVRLTPPYDLEITGASGGTVNGAGSGGTGTDVDAYGLRITDLALRYPSPLPDDAANPGQKIYSVLLYARFQDQRVDLAGRQESTLSPVLSQLRPIAALTIRVNASSQIVSCESTPQDPVANCAAQGKIYMASGPGVPKPLLTDSTDAQLHPGEVLDPNAGQNLTNHDGCVDPRAFIGKRGPPGVPGQPMVGAPGQPGQILPNPTYIPNPVPVAVPACAPMPPPPPPMPPPVIPSTPKWSDARVKTETGSFEYGLSEVLKIRPIWFSYNGLAGTAKGERHAGVIAQELEQVAPKLVEHMSAKLKPDDSAAQDLLKVHYEEMSLMLLRAVQEQQREIDDLKKQIDVEAK